MTDRESCLLSAMISNGGGVFVREVVGKDRDTMRLLIARGYVAIEGALDVAAYTVTDEGRIALAEHHQKINDLIRKEAREDTDEKRKRFDEWLRFGLGLIIGWLLGAITPVNLLDLVLKALGLR